LAAAIVLAFVALVAIPEHALELVGMAVWLACSWAVSFSIWGRRSKERPPAPPPSLVASVAGAVAHFSEEYGEWADLYYVLVGGLTFQVSAEAQKAFTRDHHYRLYYLRVYPLRLLSAEPLSSPS
jgi:hypothetical protein